MQKPSMEEIMKLQQLRYIWEVVRHNLNISSTAESLFTSQPGVSKQIRLLEDELGVPIFNRRGKHLTELTPAGRIIVEKAGEILTKVEGIRQVAAEFNDQSKGTLSIATTHTQARYVLPSVIESFIKRFPEVRFNLNQGTPVQISDLVARGDVDMAIATEALDLYDNLVMLPCYQWTRCILVRKGHPLEQEKELTLKSIAKFPIVTYVFGFTGRSVLDQAFAEQGLDPQVVLTAVDADVIKTYVRSGLGVGIIAKLAYDPIADQDLVALDAAHLFQPSVTHIGLRRDMYIRTYMYDFIESFAPHLKRDVVDRALRMQSQSEIQSLFKQALPER